MMKEILQSRLRAHLAAYHMDRLLELQDQRALTPYLGNQVKSVLPLAAQMQKEGHPESSIVQRCMEKLTRSLGPSRYRFILRFLAQEFTAEHRQMVESGKLTLQAVRLTRACAVVFNEAEFSFRTEGQQRFRNAIRTAIARELTTEKTKEQ